MTTMPAQGPVATVKSQPDVYTLLLILAIIVLGVTVGIILHNLMTAYGMTLAEIFTGKGKGLPPI